jgi:hypothetical protein
MLTIDFRSLTTESFALFMYSKKSCYVYMERKTDMYFWTAKRAVNVNTGVGKSRFTVVRMEKDVQVMIITIALLITATIIRQIIQIINK